MNRYIWPDRRVPWARRVGFVVLVALLLCVLPRARPVLAATFAVNTNIDSADANPGNGVCADSSARCSLRAAIEESNARAGMDTVQVPANTYTLSNQLVVRDSLFLTGAGKNLTLLNGNNAVEVLQVRTVELLVCDSGNNSIASYDPNGERNVDFLGASAGGMDVPGGIAVGPGNDVFVTAFSSGVHRFSSTGAPEGLFVDPDDVTPAGFAPSTGIFGAIPEAPNSDFYVADYFPGNRVLRVDRISGARSNYVASGSGGLAQPSGLAFYEDDLYVTSTGSNQVLRYDGANGSFDEVFIDQFPAGLSRPRGLVFHNNSLYVANEDSDSVLKFNAASGALQSVFVTAGSGGGQTSQGGGIFNSGVLSIERSLISGNFATRGGGISNTNNGRVELTNTTISANRAIGAGGGVRNVADGIVNISSSTITANRANEPGGFGSEPTPFGGGVFNEGEARVSMANTILAGNTDNRTRFQTEFSPDCYSPTAFRFTSHRDKLVGILTSNCVLRDTIWGDTRFDQVGSPTAPLDPQLQPLADNGGPTRTHALNIGSPAVDEDTAVTSATFFDCPAVDQRGNPRPQGDDCDVGAYERTQGSVMAPEGSSVPMSALPRFAGEAGLAALLTNNTAGSGAATLSFVSLEAGVSAAQLTNVSGRTIRLDLAGADSGDVLEASFYYPSTVDSATESAADFRLLYHNGSVWLPVRGGGASAPAKDTSDNQNGSVSGGRFGVRFDNSSAPRVNELRNISFAATLKATGAVFLPFARK